MVKYEPSCQLLVGGDTFPISCKWYLSRRIKQPSWNWKKGFVSAASALMLSELLWTTSCDQIIWKVSNSKRNHISVAFRPKWSSKPHSIWVSKALCKPQQILLTGRTSIISGDCDPLTGKWVVYTLEFSFWSGKERKRKNYFTFHIWASCLCLT